MRIIHIDTGREWRGGQSQTLMLAEGLTKLGCENIILTRKGSAMSRKSFPQNVRCEEATLRFELDPSFAAKARSLGKESTPSILHAHTPHALGLAILARRMGFRGPIVFTRRVAFPVRKFFVNRWKFRQPDRLVAVSATVAAELEKAGVPKDRISVIHSAVDTGRFSYHGPHESHPLNIVILGAIEKAKGIEEAQAFVEASAGLPVKFHFIGEGDGMESLKSWQPPGLEFEVHGFVEDVAGFLRNMFAAISFSPVEGFPNMILQAMAAGLPVLAFANDAVREIISDPGLGFLFLSKEDALASLAGLTQNRQLAIETGKRASHSVSSRFSHTRMSGQYYELYKEILL